MGQQVWPSLSSLIGSEKFESTTYLSRVSNLERETGVDAPSTEHLVEFICRIS